LKPLPNRRKAAQLDNWGKVENPPLLTHQCLKEASFVCLFVWWVSKAGEIRTLPKTSLPVAVLRVAKGRIP
jgi:hypothetical protein